MSGFAQSLSNYIMTTGTDATKWETLSSPTTILELGTSTSGDSKASAVTNIGFTFNFAGTDYTQFSVNSDGNLRFGSTVTGTANYSTPFSSSNANINNPKINILGCDGYITDSGHVYHEVIGTAPNRICVIEFATSTYISSSRNSVLRWQVQLFETSNEIQIVFPSQLPPILPAAARQPGMCVNSSNIILIDAGHGAAFYNAGQSSNQVPTGTWPDVDRYYHFTIASCSTPSAITASNITTNSADVTWGAPAGASSFILEYKPANGTWADDAVLVNISGDTNYSLTGLTPNTHYDVRVSNDCGTEQSNYFTATFHTECVAISQLPYTDGFEYSPSGSYQMPYCWNRYTSAHTTTTTYPYSYNNSNYAHNGSQSLYFYGTTSTNYPDTMMAIMPQLDVDTYPMNGNRVTFWAKMSSASYNKYLYVGTLTNPADPSTFALVDSVLVSGTSFAFYSVPMTNATDSYVAFVVYKGSGTIYMDDVTLEEMPSCLEINHLTVTATTANSISLSWVDAANSGATYTIYDMSNNTIVGTAITTTYTVENLNANTTYTFGVQANCISGDALIMTISGRTNCGPEILPYSETFDASLSNDPCWYGATGVTADEALSGIALNLTSNQWTYSSSVSNGLPAGHYRVNIYGSSCKRWMITPEIDLTDATSPLLNFDVAFTQYNSSSTDPASGFEGNTSQLFMVLVTTNNCQTWTAIKNINLTSIASSSYLPQYIDLSVFAGQIIRIAFYAQSLISGGSNNLHIDNILVKENTDGLCLPVNLLTANNISNSEATLSWTSNADSYNVYVIADGDTTFVQNVTTDSLVLTDLSAITTYTYGVRAVCGGNESLIYTVTFTTACTAIDSFPYVENFDTYGTGSTTYPSCWGKINTYTSSDRPYISNTHYSAPGSMYFYSGTSGTYNIAITPSFDASIPINTLQATFMYRASDTTDRLIVGVMSNPADANTFTPIDTVYPVIPASTWIPYEVSFSPYNGEGQYIAFKNEYTTTNGYGYLDNLVIDLIPSCPRPLHVTASNPTTNSIDLAWDQEGSPSSWVIEYGPAGFTPGNGTEVTTTAHSITVTGLNSATIYDFYVTANCGGGDSSARSFVCRGATECTAVDQLPFVENFDTYGTGTTIYPLCWSKINIASNYYPSINSTHYDGVGSLYFYATSATYNIAILPQFDATIPVNTLQASFMYRASNSSNDRLVVGVMTDPNDATTFVAVDTVYPAITASTWVEREVSFNSYTGAGQYIAFYNGNPSATCYSYIDNLIIDLIPTCPKPSHVNVTAITDNSATLSWTAGGSETSWEIAYGPAGFDPDGTSATVIPANTNPFTVQNLTPATPYEFYVRANCSATEQSPWSTQSASGVTQCSGSVALPYTEDFEGYTGTVYNDPNGIAPACWTTSSNNATYGPPHITGSGSYHYVHSGTNCMVFTCSSAGSDAYAALPTFNGSLNSLTLNFWRAMESTSQGTLTVGYVTNLTDLASSFVTVATIPSVSSTAGDTISVDFTAAGIPTTGNICFHWTQASTFYSCCIDDINVTSYEPTAGDGQPCPGTPTVTDYDGNTYNTVKIGEQCWMKENLRTTHYADGTDIPAGGSNTSYTDPYYYDYSSSSIPLAQRGYLYNWTAAMHGMSSSYSNPSNVQGVCPNGWHLPSDAEWAQLTNYVSSQSAYSCGGDSSYIAKALASTEGWDNIGNACAVGNNQASNNATGFSAVPAGVRNGTSFLNAGGDALFWSSSEFSSYYAWYRTLYYDFATVNRYDDGSKYNGFSVRCLLNPPCTPSTSEFSATSCDDYTWNDTTYTVSGDYTQTLTNAGGCDSVVTLHLTITPTPTTVTITGDHYICENGSTTLTAQSNVTGVFTWNDGTIGATHVVAEGDYYVTLTTAQGCSMTSSNFTVESIGTDLSVSASNTSICQGEHTIVYVDQDGWQDNVTYQWDAQAGNSTGTTVDVHPEVNTNYHVTATVHSTNGNCSVEGFVTIFVHPLPVISGVTASETIVCEGTQVTFTATGDANTTAYIWYNNGVEIPYENQASLTVTSNEAAIYSLTAKAISPFGCVSQTVGEAINVTVFPSFSTSISETICEGSSYDFLGQPISYPGIYTYTLQSVNGCDSVVTLHLTVDSCGTSGDGQPCSGTPTVTDYDGNTYNTVQIGQQCWMKENLRVTHYADGTAIPAGGENTSYFDPFYYINPNLDAATYGYYYNYPAAIHGNGTSSNVQGVCPNGWHMPSDSEWGQLINYVSSQNEYSCGGNPGNIAKALASTEGWNNSGNDCTIGNNQATNNATGFSAFPASFCYGTTISWGGDQAEFWSTQFTGPYNARSYYLSSENTSMNSYEMQPTYLGLSIRCLRGAGLNLPSVKTDSIWNIGTTTATCGSEVTDNGGTEVLSRGVYWGYSPDEVWQGPTTDGSGTGAFTSLITGLAPSAGITYWVRAYASNSVGFTLGNAVSFTTLSICDHTCTYTIELFDSSDYGLLYVVQEGIPSRLFGLQFGDSATVNFCHGVPVELIWNNPDYPSSEVSITVIGPDSVMLFTPSDMSSGTSVFTFIPDCGGPHFTTNTDENGNVTPLGTVPFVSGESYTLTITPNTGYHLLAIYKNGIQMRGESQNYDTVEHYTFTPNDGDSIYVTFTPNRYEVTATVENLYVTEYNNNAIGATYTPNHEWVNHGDSHTGIITLEPHYHIENVTVNGVDVMNSSLIIDANNQYQLLLDNIIEDQDIHVVVGLDTFAIMYYVTSGQGTINNAFTVDASTSLPAFYSITIPYYNSLYSTITPAPGYHVSSFMIDGVEHSIIDGYAFNHVSSSHLVEVAFSPNHYVISTAGYGNGTVSAGVEFDYDPSFTYTFTATPNAGHRISTVQRNYIAQTVADPVAGYTETLTNILDNYNYVVTFEPNTYTLITNCGANGTISPNGVSNYFYHQNAEVSITANLGYYISSVTHNGVTNYYTQADDQTSLVIQLSNIENNHTISATFAQKEFVVTVNAGANGTITPGTSSFNYGATPTFTITPNIGYLISDVTVDGSSVGQASTYTFTALNSDHTIAATFVAQTFTITATASEGGTISPNGVSSVAYNSNKTFTITANAGRHVSDVFVDGVSVGAVSSYSFTGVTANHTIHATFAVNEYTITVVQPTHGTIAPGTTTVQYGATPSFVITPETGYDVTTINVNNSNVINSATNTNGIYTYTFPQITGNKTLTATTTIKAYTITATAGSGGAINPNGSTTVYYNSNKTYTFTPNTNYEIDNVVVDGVSVGSPSSYTFVNIVSNHTIHVTFKATPVIPTVTTYDVSNISSNSATSGGNVTSNGGANVTARGVCWSTSPDPTVSDSHTSDGIGTGNFASDMTNLTPNTTYYVRAFATNSVGTGYGEEKSFTTTCNSISVSITGNSSIDYGQSVTLTASDAVSYIWSTGENTESITVSPTSTTTYSVTGTNQYGCTATASKTVTVNPVMPSVTTYEVFNISSNSATSGGDVTSDGGGNVTARGVCWSTSPNPMVSDMHTMNGGGTGDFTSSISNLTPNTTYYLRAYATNSVGTAYGATRTFTTTCNNVSVTISGNSSINHGQSTTLTASGANSYVWSTGESTASITVSPITTTTYNVTGTNQYGCTASATKTVTVNITTPTVITSEVTDISSHSAISGGEVTHDGGATVLVRGVCWNTSPSPTVDDSFTSDGSGTGVFTSIIEGLTRNTTYYLRAYAANSAGIAYGNEVTFTTAEQTDTNHLPEMIVYPNPASDVIHLLISDTSLIGGSSHLFLYDAAGHRTHLAPVTDANTEISCAGLNQGVYFLELNVDGITVKTFKIIIKKQ